ncbi:DUF305 domain-containing protein [Nostocoides sp.]|jgi:uncharacterized protein (DUF305 family)|uniref:DUF305 domain-containing protein n=1 Tax=Nostocoides sp. TaxID=1917966 RepID=UPI003BB0AB64
MTKGLPVENRFRLVLVWLLAASSLVLFSVVAPSARANAPAQDPKVADFEVDFMTDMIDHHAMAVMMAESCVQKAVHEDLASMCESIGATQSQEILQMQSWLAEWYGDSHEPQMTTGQKRSMAHLDRLEGEEYEIAFMRSMIRHHWSAVREAARCLDNAEHPELLSLCESIEAAQLEEIARMQGWLEQWYDVRGGRPADTA